MPDNCPSKVRKVDSGQHDQYGSFQQTKLRFVEPAHVTSDQIKQMKYDSQQKGPRYSNGEYNSKCMLNLYEIICLRFSHSIKQNSIEGRIMSQEMVKELTEECLNAPLSEDEAQFLDRADTSDAKGLNPPFDFMLAANSLHTPRPPPRQAAQPHNTGKQGPPHPAQRPASSIQHNSSPLFSKASSPTTNMEEIEACLERYRIKFHLELKNLFLELKAELKAGKQESSQLNNTRA